VPDTGGTAFEVVLVAVMNLGAPDAYRLAWLRRQAETGKAPAG